MTTVYLAGPIGDIGSGEAIGWRLHAGEVLKKAGFHVIDPLDGKDPRRFDYDPAWIVGTDLASVDRSDIILADISREGASYIGTAIEIRYAWEKVKYIYTWGKAKQNSYWLRYHATKMFDTLPLALDFLLESKKGVVA